MQDRVNRPFKTGLTGWFGQNENKYLLNSCLEWNLETFCIRNLTMKIIHLLTRLISVFHLDNFGRLWNKNLFCCYCHWKRFKYVIWFKNFKLDQSSLFFLLPKPTIPSVKIEQFGPVKIQQFDRKRIKNGASQEKRLIFFLLILICVLSYIPWLSEPRR